MRKTKTAYWIDMVNDYVNQGRNKGILHLQTKDNSYNGREVFIGNQKLINFGSCSYLGLELDSRLKESAKQCIDRYGVQFSSSRAYLGCSLYEEWDELLREVFQAPVVTFSSVSIGHHAVIPVLVEPGDAILMDQQVHASVQDAAKKMLLNNVHIEPVRHNRLDLLELRLKDLNNKYDRIWYMIDGVYSMYGDFAPMIEIVALMEKYPKLYVYVDDAHGMSISGKNGAGVVCNQVSLNKKMILATSLNKAFAAGGGAFVFPNEELALRVKNCGGAYIFSGGHQIPVIGAGIASARIHLTDEIYLLQMELRSKLDYCHRALEQNALPVLSNPESPIFFIGVGLVKTCIEMVTRLHKEGCHVNVGMFPAVPEQSAGIRFTVTTHHTQRDIDYLVDRIAYHYPRVFQELGRSERDIHRGFRRLKSFSRLIKGIPTDISSVGGFEVQHETSIQSISKSLWDDYVGGIGANDWAQMAFFESVFSRNEEVENNWSFHYFIVRDKEGEVVLATFFTEVLAKDDMFSSPQISKQIMQQRIERKDDYYMTSYTLTMGCLLSVGQHIYIDKNSPGWKSAFSVLFEKLQVLREEKDIPVLSLRDFDTDDLEIKELFVELGLRRLNIPDGHMVDNYDWASNDDFIKQLHGSSSKSTADRRSYMKKRVFEYEDRFEVKTVVSATLEQTKYYRQLYLNVSERSYEITGFLLPIKFFQHVIDHPNWELLELTLKDGYDDRGESKPVGIAISYRSASFYSFLVTGIDYDFFADHNVYPQVLWQTVKRAKTLNLTLNMGITASQPKRKFGARLVKNSIYIQNKDTYKESLVNLLADQATAVLADA